MAQPILYPDLVGMVGEYVEPLPHLRRFVIEQFGTPEKYADSIAKDIYDTLVPLRQSLMEPRARLAALEERGPVGMSEEEYSTLIEELVEKVNEVSNVSD